MLLWILALVIPLITPVNNQHLIVNWTGTTQWRNRGDIRREWKGALPSREVIMLSAANPKSAPPTSRSIFEPLLDLQEAALVLGMHWKTLEIKARQRRVPAVKVGKRWRFRLSSLNNWLDEGIKSNTTDQAAVTRQEQHP